MRRHSIPPKMHRFLLLLQCCYYLCNFAHCDAFSFSSQRQRLAAITSSSSSSLLARRRPSLLPHDESITGGVRISLDCKNANAVKPLYSAVSPEAAEETSVLDHGGETPLDADAEALSKPLIIQWRGEGTEGYSEALRQLEFTSAFLAEMKDYLTIFSDMDNKDSIQSSSKIEQYLEGIQFHFRDALTYYGPIYYEPSMKENYNSDDRIRMDASNAEFEGEPIPLAQAEAYESAMQYVIVSLPSGLEPSTSKNSITSSIDTTTLQEVFQSTVQRCSLIRTAFQVVAEGQSYEELATKAINDGSFDDMMEGGTNEDATWSIRLRRYGPMEVVSSSSDDDVADGTQKTRRRQARYGKNVRSPLRDERKAIFSMAELVQLFRGKVDLTDPESRIYLLEGLQRCDLRMMGRSDAASIMHDMDGDTDTIDDGDKLLARAIAKGPKTSIYAPKTRLCITTTPLCPIASFTLCNIARLSRHGSPAILDPFAGSCATLLAAAHITSIPKESVHNLPKLQFKPEGCRSVAIEIAHNGYVNKDDIVRDFETRSLHPPTEIIRGSCLSADVRHRARLAIGRDSAFDVIVTDPPYGIREAMGSDDNDENDQEDDSLSPLTQLFYAMGQDRLNGTPLLKRGGRLVAFIPVRSGESLNDCLPDLNARKEAGLVMEGEGKEQVLSDILSRWLVSFVCV